MSNLYFALSANTMWQVSPATNVNPLANVGIGWVIEVNDPIGGRGARIAATFKDQNSADVACRALNRGAAPAELGFSVKHLAE
jgi:hypothetical protein